MKAWPLALALFASAAWPPAQAEDLYNGSPFAALATDRSAAAPGDVLTIIVYQSAEARNAAQNSSRDRKSVV